MEQLTLNFGRGRFVCKRWTFHMHAHKCNRFKAHSFTIYGEAKKWFEKRFTAMSSSSSSNNDAHILHMFLWINMNALNISCHCFYEYFVSVFRGYWFLFFMMWLYVACVYSLNIFWLCVCSASFLVTHEIQFADALGRKWAHTLKAIWIHTHKLVVMELMSLLSLSLSLCSSLSIQISTFFSTLKLNIFCSLRPFYNVFGFIFDCHSGRKKNIENSFTYLKMESTCEACSRIYSALISKNEIKYQITNNTKECFRSCF